MTKPFRQRRKSFIDAHTYKASIRFHHIPKSKAAHDWYLLVYADAYEWVELPNTLGMSQFTDGGFLSSKPYAASGNDINKMSNYCSGCRYNVKEKTGQEAGLPPQLPLLGFPRSQPGQVTKNPRLGPVYRTWTRMDEAKRNAYRTSARSFLDRLF